MSTPLSGKEEGNTTDMPSTRELYEKYESHMRRIADVRYASAVLQWDQETYLPSKGNETRSRQIATLNELAHDLFTDERTGHLLESLAAKDDLTDRQQRNIELSLYDYTKNKKLTPAFVRQMSESVNKGFHAWLQARKENDFTSFSQPLKEVVAFKQQEADMLGYSAHPYDALLNDYDRGMTVQLTDELFGSLRKDLQHLLHRIQQKPQVDHSFLQQGFDKSRQWQYGLYLLGQMHFDFDAGRQDLSEHPFTINFNSRDVRITTRIDEQDFSNMTWSCIHEGGHALYEQGLPAEEYGMPLGEYCSVSIHESQSRLWENCIGRSRAFWAAQYPYLQSVFPAELNGVDLENFYKGINCVKPSLIRTEADELTYHFHVMVRYELEKKLISGELQTQDIPAAWNELYSDYLGVHVPDDRRGCLQDVHWGHGSFGYFSTYSTGSLYAAQLYDRLVNSIPGLSTWAGSIETTRVHDWLKQHIYQFGRYHTAEELCTRATGEPLNSRYFIDYATQKFSDIYGI